MKDLEVLLCAQELVVVLSRLLLSLQDFILLRLDDLLELQLLIHDQFHVLLLACELGLEAGDRGRAGVLVGVLLESLGL
jgi:hypothetical protein